jgi:inosine-uridine nucleoside N-ribohydrolase
MGGVLVPLLHRGAVRAVEHNVGSDPAAAAAVFGHGRPLVVVPLDVTVGMVVAPTRLDDLFARIRGLDREVARWRQWVAATQSMHEDDVRLVLHDPLALLVCARDDASDADIERRALAVDATGRLVGRGDAHDVVVHADTTRALARVFELVG